MTAIALIMLFIGSDGHVSQVGKVADFTDMPKCIEAKLKVEDIEKQYGLHDRLICLKGTIK